MASTSTTEEEFGRCPPVRAPPALLPDDCLFLFFGAASGWSRGSPLALVEGPCRRESDEDNDDDDDDDKRDEEGKVEAMYVELDDADDDDSSEEEDEEEEEEDFFVLRLGSSGAFDDRLCLRSLRWR